MHSVDIVNTYLNRQLLYTHNQRQLNVLNLNVPGVVEFGTVVGAVVVDGVFASKY